MENSAFAIQFPSEGFNAEYLWMSFKWPVELDNVYFFSHM